MKETDQRPKDMKQISRPSCQTSPQKQQRGKLHYKGYKPYILPARVYQRSCFHWFWLDTTKALRVSNIIEKNKKYHTGIIICFPISTIEVGCLLICKMTICISSTVKYNFMCSKYFYLVTSIFSLPQHSSKPILVQSIKKSVKDLVFINYPPLKTPAMRLICLAQPLIKTSELSFLLY